MGGGIGGNAECVPLHGFLVIVTFLAKWSGHLDLLHRMCVSLPLHLFDFLGHDLFDSHRAEFCLTACGLPFANAAGVEWH